MAFANARRVAASESLTTAKRLRDIPENWRARLGRVRRRSATDQLLEVITSTPVFSADDAGTLVTAPTSGVYASVQRLVDAEILAPLTQSRRNQIWGAVDILDELEELSTRIEIAARSR